MFETSVVRAQAKRADRRAALLSVSIAAHAAIIIGAVVASVSTVSLPRHAPNQFSVPVFSMPVVMPPKLGDGGAKKSAAALPPQTVKRPAAVPAGPVAPRVVPDRVAPLSSAPASTDTGPVGNAASGLGTDANSDPGVRWGTKDSVGEDVPSSNDVPTKIYTVADGVKPPVVIRRVSPPYPAAAQRIRLNGFVILECVIDQTGRIRDAHVVRSSFGAFEQPALDAVQQWQFLPGTLNGRPVDVVFNLKVTFEIH